MLTPKELEIVEELCSSLSDVKRKKALQREVSDIRESYADSKPAKKKVGRPKKTKNEGGSTSYDNPPHFNTLEERDLYYK